MVGTQGMTRQNTQSTSKELQQLLLKEFLMLWSWRTRFQSHIFLTIFTITWSQMTMKIFHTSSKFPEQEPSKWAIKECLSFLSLKVVTGPIVSLLEISVCSFIKMNLKAKMLHSILQEILQRKEVDSHNQLRKKEHQQEEAHLRINQILALLNLSSHQHQYLYNHFKLRLDLLNRK